MAVVFDKHTILLVDDEPFSRMLVGQMLQRMGFAGVLLAESAREAIELLEREPITAVITDFRMPGMTGLQLLKAIRTGKTMAERNLPCALLTTHSEHHLVNLAIVLDADTFLAKPVSLETLAKHLNRCFQYRFEPLDIASYDEIDVDNAAPHLAIPDPEKAGTLERPTPVPVNVGVQSKAPETPIKAIRTSAEEKPKADAKPITKDARPAAPPAAKASKPGAAGRPVPAEEPTLRGPAKKVAIADVPENAVLAKNVVGSSGTLLLAAGTRFKARYAKRLEELQEGNIDYVWIYE
jgi:CheY-like chemotaxis protein